VIRDSGNHDPSRSPHQFRKSRPVTTVTTHWVLNLIRELAVSSYLCRVAWVSDRNTRSPLGLEQGDNEKQIASEGALKFTILEVLMCNNFTSQLRKPRRQPFRIQGDIYIFWRTDLRRQLTKVVGFFLTWHFFLRAFEACSDKETMGQQPPKEC
jgi:hypothetical protein